MTEQEKTEIVVHESNSSVPAIYSAEDLIKEAINKNVSVETMERLLAMRKELREERAKEEFDSSMADFQGECPVIKKDKSVYTNDKKKAYSYAPLDTIVSQTKEILRKHGFSYAVQTETMEGKVKVSCVVKHKASHSETSSIEVPLGNKTQIMSQTQVVAAALTFAKRYAFCNAFGILTGDEDDDAISTKSAEKMPTGPQQKTSNLIERASNDQIRHIYTLAKGMGKDQGETKQWIIKTLKINNFTDITFAGAKKIIDILQQKTEQIRKSGELSNDEKQEIINMKV